jgi:niacin transporter
MSKTTRLAFTGLLTALAIVLPLTMPKIYIPPFSATLASHVPLFIAALISPFTGAAAVVGATIGFSSP